MPEIANNWRELRALRARIEAVERRDANTRQVLEQVREDAHAARSNTELMLPIVQRLQQESAGRQRDREHWSQLPAPPRSPTTWRPGSWPPGRRTAAISSVVTALAAAIAYGLQLLAQ